jgi:hypothetical protein
LASSLLQAPLQSAQAFVVQELYFIVLALLFHVFRCWVVRSVPKVHLVFKDKSCAPNKSCDNNREHHQSGIIKTTAYVIMPNHVHCILFFLTEQYDLSKIKANGNRFMAYEN